jgi:AcrR family transcriptional regulator
VTNTPRPPRPRPVGLTRDRIVDAAIELLDAHGQSGLTYRALAFELKTGHGAIQWHVANKEELLVAAAIGALTRALEKPGPGTPPQPAIRAVALGVFDAIDAHPWLGAQLFAVPWQPAMVQLWEQIGRPLEELGVPERSLFTAVSTLVSYIVGVGSQNAMNTHAVAGHSSRDDFLHAVARRWENLDPAEHPFVRRVAGQLRVHDDRQEFLAGIDIILDGLQAAAKSS